MDAKTPEWELGYRARGLVIRKSMRAGKGVPRLLPTIEEFVEDLQLLVKRQHAQAQLKLIEQIVSSEGAERARGLLLLSISRNLQDTIRECNEALSERDRRPADMQA